MRQLRTFAAAKQGQSANRQQTHRRRFGDSRYSDLCRINLVVAIDPETGDSRQRTRSTGKIGQVKSRSRQGIALILPVILGGRGDGGVISRCQSQGPSGNDATAIHGFDSYGVIANVLDQIEYLSVPVIDCGVQTEVGVIR